MVANFSWFALDPKAGINLQQTQTINTTTNPEVPAPFANLGDRCQGNNDSVWVFVKASTTVTAGNLVAIDEAYNANNMTPTLAASLRFGVGIAQFYSSAFGPAGIISTLQQGLAQPGDYFWAAQQGNGLVMNITATAVGNTQLYVNASVNGSVSASVTTAIVHNLFTGLASAQPTGSNSTIDVSAIAPIFTSA